MYELRNVYRVRSKKPGSWLNQERIYLPSCEADTIESSKGKFVSGLCVLEVSETISLKIAVKQSASRYDDGDTTLIITHRSIGAAMIRVNSDVELLKEDVVRFDAERITEARAVALKREVKRMKKLERDYADDLNENASKAIKKAEKQEAKYEAICKELDKLLAKESKK
jgi:hypothetical protein